MSAFSEPMKNRLKVLLFTAPLLVPLFTFWLVPFGYSIYISFTDWDYISPDYSFIGLENYEYMVEDYEFIQAMLNTFWFSVGVVIPTIILGLVFAMLLHKNFKGSQFYRAVIFSPWITPTVAVSIVWSWVFETKSGLANHLLESAGFSAIPWLENGNTALVAVIIVTVWQAIGWTMLFYISALNKIPESLYEASLIDGCSSLTRFLKITLPLISPTTFFLVVVNIITAMQAFDQFQILTQGGPGGETRTLLYLFYQQAFERYEMGPAAATSLVIFLITGLLALINTYIGKRWVYY
ncbi:MULTISPECIES: carbohydrate ABC transporter permease [Vibrio]|jgi:multiple sugar transport system permease protein|uniref:carbohydrate ABC transporter permease n=1 Tax=Vibrio TaxID=662 RepID=UPI000F4AE3BE|nr:MULTISPECIES: sugar ABC transporter permease [Vibrio]CAH7080349.1 N-Acetyl-D-glucosamine ABC transport system, permease protein 1 [Vibrio chagasii]MCG9694560.1 sugar ABC transporter permease [Vibrio sp. Isolate22]NOI87204.1 sugar ABC transporter permease [Vibrio sp. 99K-1]ROO72137.1 carbohydrate ABC transporter membrane protein 1 (CUT1 family) [Vibrio crassostreae]ROP10732.1 carbohydrate ABC transporter membrane protein 1 (CUT1 family) [Vibrio crassostreae]